MIHVKVLRELRLKESCIILTRALNLCLYFDETHGSIKMQTME